VNLLPNTGEGAEMNPIQTLHQQAMDLAENAFTAKLKGDRTQADQLLQQAFAKEA